MRIHDWALSSVKFDYRKMHLPYGYTPPGCRVFRYLCTDVCYVSSAQQLVGVVVTPVRWVERRPILR